MGLLNKKFEVGIPHKFIMLTIVNSDRKKPQETHLQGPIITERAVVDRFKQ